MNVFLLICHCVSGGRSSLSVARRRRVKNRRTRRTVDSHLTLLEFRHASPTITDQKRRKLTYHHGTVLSRRTVESCSKRMDGALNRYDLMSMARIDYCRYSFPFPWLILYFKSNFTTDKTIISGIKYYTM